MVGIYKITNKINNKIYIGQSVRIEIRFQEHCYPSANKVIDKAIKKYGKENFSFDVIEECSVADLNEREQYWMNYYNSWSPYGYNITEDTETTHTTYIYKNKEEILSIINDLLNSQLTMQQIANKYNINISNISRINKGETHRQENLLYPLREKNKKQNSINKKYNKCIDCGKIINFSSTRCNQCEGKHKRIPLENMKVTREELKQLIRNYSFVTIGKKFNVADNSIRKWCDKFNLPRTKKEINQYTEEQWQNI